MATEQIEKLVKKRSSARRLLTITTKLLAEKVGREEIEGIQGMMPMLEKRAQDLFQFDTELQTELHDLDIPEEDFEKLMDMEGSANREVEYRTLKVRCEKLLQNHVEASEYGSASSTLNEAKRRFKLPHIELTKFDGDLTNWLGFWGQFKKIDADKSIDDDDKFQYLLSATEPGSSARELVESFPPSGANYHKALEQMKSRFAKDELLIQCYVRKLLEIVLCHENSQGFVELRTLYDKLITQLRALETLGVTSDKYAAMLYPLVESAIPEGTLRVWERSPKKNNEDLLAQLLEFLRLEVDCEEKVLMAKSAFLDGQMRRKEPSASCIVSTEQRKKPETSNRKNTDNACIWCDRTTHSSTECFQSKKMSLEEKRNTVKSKKACFICLKIGHPAIRCRSYVRCLYCTKRHTFVMCPEVNNRNSAVDIQPSTSKLSNASAASEKKTDKEDDRLVTNVSNQGVFTCHKTTTTLLQTILVNIVYNGKIVKVRAFFDSGAQRSYVSMQVIKELGLEPVRREAMRHCLFGGVETAVQNHNVYKLNIQNLEGSFEFILTALDKDKVCGYLPRLDDPMIVQRLEKAGIVLNDNDANYTRVDVLIGADHLGFLLTGEVHQASDTLSALKTKLGWVIQGTTTNACVSTQVTNLHSVADLWDLETIGIKDPAETKKSEVAKREVMTYFKDTVVKNAEGRYEVNLPWREDVWLSNNKELAIKRLYSTTKRLTTTGHFKEYDDSLKEWLQLGIIEQVEGNDDGHFLPHHAVVKESSLTTRVRPVFDASAKDANGRSLNSSLEAGINLLELIPNILVHFRQYEYGVTADIKKAFLQISLAQEDRKYLQFLWWAGEERRQLITYRHCRVVFGVTSSPFLLNATIRHHLEGDDIPAHLKETADKLKRSFYVDNCLTSCSSLQGLHKFIEEAKELMLLAKMDLRGWISGPADEGTVVSTLGLMWDTKRDVMMVNTKPLQYNGERVTTRLMLSLVHRVFDPIGFTSPVSLKAKLLLRQAHRSKFGWDEEISADIAKAFIKWVQKLECLKEIHIPRRMTSYCINNCSLQVHVFCDASKEAYAAAVFLRSQFEDDTYVQLVAAKSRVAPTKETSDISMPRLELLGAVIGVRLYKQFVESFSFDHECWFWTDSSVVLAWIQNNGSRDIFVRNRIKEIRKFSSVQRWQHLPGWENPADLPSRGCEADVLKDSLWWEGPGWLKLHPTEWPTSVVNSNVVHEVDEERFSDRLLYFSKYTMIVNTVAWVFRFYHNCRKPARERVLNKQLCQEEIENAERRTFKVIQRESFGHTDTYKDLCTFVDSDGLIKVKTKLFSEDIPFCYRFPVLLPGKNKVIERLVRHKHRELMHAGTSTLLTNLRQTLWITGIRMLVKSVSKKCVVCRKHRGKAFVTPPVQLPIDRTKAGKPFQVTGVDLAGPLLLRDGSKVWLVLYTCAVYRAVHFELVDSLSTSDFLLSFRRFIARRGRVITVYSDNGTNFVGSVNLFKSINWDDIAAQSAVQRIDWIFIPPGSPWWGGWWERLVRMVKELLRRVLGKASLNLLELQTVVNEAEAVINSRPLSYVADDVDVLTQPITPALFLQPLPCTEVPDLDFLDGKNLNLRMKYLQKLRDDLKTRFCNEYLSILVLRGKDTLFIPKVGDVVLVSSSEKRMFWPLGIVEELYKGKDGVCRVARVKTQRGELKRSVRCLYPLEGV